MSFQWENGALNMTMESESYVQNVLFRPRAGLPINDSAFRMLVLGAIRVERSPTPACNVGTAKRQPLLVCGPPAPQSEALSGPRCEAGPNCACWYGDGRPCAPMADRKL